MRKIVTITLLCVLVFAVAASAADAPTQTANSKREAELLTRQKEIIIESGQRQEIVNTQTAEINRLREEYLRNDGALAELQRQDAEAAKKNAPGSKPGDGNK